MRRNSGIALGVLLFLLTLGLVFAFTLPGEVLISPFQTALAARGVEMSCAESRFALPLGLRCKTLVVAFPGGTPLTLDNAYAGFEWTGLFRWLPIHGRAERGKASVDVRTSPFLSNPRKVRVHVEKLSSDDLEGLLPASAGAGFSIETADIQLDRNSKGAVAGKGEGTLAWLRLPVNAADSPVTEALLRDVRVKFAVRDGTVHVSSLTGTYEGSAVEGTGEIARFLTPLSSSITFHLRIQNPREGKVGMLFNMVAKNTKNANLRIIGTILSPVGMFQFF